MQSRVQRELQMEQDYKNKFVKKDLVMKVRQDNYADSVMSP